MAKSKTFIRLHKIETVIGPLVLGSFEECLCLCVFPESKFISGYLEQLCRDLNAEIKYEIDECIEAASEDIRAWLEGKIVNLSQDSRVPVRGTFTNFQKKVLSHTAGIERGHTMSYGDLARELGAPDSCRAVAGALARNPLALYIPCHRIIASGGGLGGYAGGPEAKRILLELEGYLPHRLSCR